MLTFVTLLSTTHHDRVRINSRTMGINCQCSDQRFEPMPGCNTVKKFALPNFDESKCIWKGSTIFRHFLHCLRRGQVWKLHTKLQVYSDGNLCINKFFNISGLSRMKQIQEKYEKIIFLTESIVDSKIEASPSQRPLSIWSQIFCLLYETETKSMFGRGKPPRCISYYIFGVTSLTRRSITKEKLQSWNLWVNSFTKRIY